MLVMSQMHAPALIRFTHDGLRGLAYGEDCQKWIKYYGKHGNNGK
jgi:hypothetical protein